MRVFERKSIAEAKAKKIIFYLGKDFDIDESNLINILPNIRVSVKVINNSKENIQELYDFYMLENNLIELDMPVKETASYIFLGTNREDVASISQMIMEGNTYSSEYYVLTRYINIEYFKDFFQQGNLNFIILDNLPEEMPISIKGIKDEENPFKYSDIFKVKKPYNKYYGDVLGRLIGLPENNKGRLYEFFTGKLLTEKEKLENIKGRSIPSRAIVNSWNFFNSRKLLTKEEIEKKVFEGDYEGLVASINKLMFEDYNQFVYIYDLIKYLDGKMPVDLLIKIVQDTVESYNEELDDMYLPLLYYKVYSLYRSKGDYQAGSSWLKRFNISKVFKEKLPNNRSNFLYDEAEGYLLSGNYQNIIEIENEVLDDYYQLNDFTDTYHNEKISSLIAIAYNQLGRYDEGRKFIADRELKFDEATVIQELLMLNLGELNIQSLNEKQNRFEEKDEYDLDIFTGFIQVIYNIKNNCQIDNIKLLNQLLDKIAEFKEIEKVSNKKERCYDFVHITALLYKARALRDNGSFKVALGIYEEIYNKFAGSFDKYINSIVFRGLLEKAMINKELLLNSEALNTVKAGEEYLRTAGLLAIKNNNTRYDLGNKILLGITKLEVELQLNYLLPNRITEIKNMISAFEEDYPNYGLGYTLIINEILLTNALKDDDLGKCLVITEESLAYVKNNNNSENQKKLATILLLMKNKLAAYEGEERDEESYIKYLEDIIRLYVEHEDKELDTQGALCLKELADYYFELGNKKKTEEIIDRYLAVYLHQDNKKLLESTDYVKLVKAQLLFEKGAFEESRELAKQIDRKINLDLLEQRELLMAECDFKLMNIDEAITEYEYYLSRFGDRHLEDKKEKIYWNLVELFLRISNKDKALDYLDKIIKIGKMDIKELEAHRIKANLLDEYSKGLSFKAYMEGISKFHFNPELKIQNIIINIYSRIASLVTEDNDLEILKEVIERAIENFDSISTDTKNNLFTAIKSIAQTMEKKGAIEEEKYFRQTELKYFVDMKGLEFEREIANSYYRLLKISLEERDVENRDAIYQQLKQYLKNSHEPLLLEYYNKGTLEYIEEIFKRGEFTKIKDILEDFTPKSEDLKGEYYKAKVLKQLGNNKAALSLFDEIIKHGTGEIYFDSLLEKIDILKNEKSLLNRNIKKLIGDIKGTYLKRLNIVGEKYMVVAILYDLGELYEKINSFDKSQETYRDTIKEFDLETDFKTIEELKKHYNKLNDKKETSRI